MKLYWCERTRAVRAIWMMEELGVPYELVRIDIRNEQVRIDIRNEQARADPAFRAASPMGKVIAARISCGSCTPTRSSSLPWARRWAGSSRTP
jgi:glutathione S-transferase